MRVNLRYRWPSGKRMARDWKKITGVNFWEYEGRVSEHMVEEFLCFHLDKAKISYERQKPVMGANGEMLGIADIETESCVIEVKKSLDRDGVFRGMGQAFIFGQATKKVPILIGQEHEQTELFRPFVESMGIVFTPIATMPFDLLGYLRTPVRRVPWPERTDPWEGYNMTNEEAERLFWEITARELGGPLEFAPK